MRGEYYHKSNPFLENVNGYLRSVVKEQRKDVYLMDSSSGSLVTQENGDPMKFVRVQGTKSGLSDKQPYVKIFAEGLSRLMNLGIPGVKVFLWMLQHIKPKQDKIVLVPVKVAEELGYKGTKAVHDGINELMDSGVIARAFTGTRNTPAYWINPTVFYNGNRRHLYKNKDV